MRKLRITVGLVIMAFAALVCFESSKLSFGTLRRPGPGLFPLGLAAPLFFLALMFVLKTGFKRSHKDYTGTLWEGLQWERVPYTLASLFAYTLLLEHLGYLVCTWILLGWFFWGEGVKRRSIAIVGSLTASVVTYIVFKRLLGIQLPSGFLGL